MADWARDEGTDEPLLHDLCNCLADANRTAYDMFLDAFAEGVAANESEAIRVVAGQFGAFTGTFQITNPLTLPDTRFGLTPTYPATNVGEAFDGFNHLPHPELASSYLESILEAPAFKHYRDYWRAFRKANEWGEAESLSPEFVHRAKAAANALIRTRDTLAHCLIQLSEPPLFRTAPASNEVKDDWDGGFAERTAAGIGARALLLDNTFLAGCSLTYANLQWASMKEAHLQCTNLSSSHLAFANLFKSCLQGCNCRYTTFDAASMPGSVLWRADLHKASFRGSIMWSIQAQHCFAEDANFEGAKLSRANLANIRISRSNFRNADLSNCQFERANAVTVDFQSTNLWSTNFQHVNLSGSVFHGASMNSTKLFGAELGQSTFDYVHLPQDFWGNISLEEELVDPSILSATLTGNVDEALREWLADHFPDVRSS